MKPIKHKLCTEDDYEEFTTLKIDTSAPELTSEVEGFLVHQFKPKYNERKFEKYPEIRKRHALAGLYVFATDHRENAGRAADGAFYARRHRRAVTRLPSAFGSIADLPSSGAVSPSKRKLKGKAMSSTIRIQQVRSPIRRHHSQRSTLKGFDLNKIGRIASVRFNAPTWGMIQKVRHLISFPDQGYL